MRPISVSFVSLTRLLYHPTHFVITARTWPVSGVFTPAQKALYQAVLNVQKTCIPLCTERARVSLHDLHQRSSSLVSQELAALGFKLRYGDMDRLLYPHFLTHPVGIGTCYSDTILKVTLLLLIGFPLDVHESENERSQKYVQFVILDTGLMREVQAEQWDGNYH